MTGTCRTTLESLGAHVDGALDPREEGALLAHLQSCARCTEFLASYRCTSKIIGAATDVAIPADVEEKLLAFLMNRRPD